MKISAKILWAFNARKETTFNDNYNKANGLPTLAESDFLRSVQNDKYGMFPEPITQKDIKKYLETPHIKYL